MTRRAPLNSGLPELPNVTKPRSQVTDQKGMLAAAPPSSTAIDFGLPSGWLIETAGPESAVARSQPA